MDWGRFFRSGYRLRPTAHQPNPAEHSESRTRVGVSPLPLRVRGPACDVFLVDVRYCLLTCLVPSVVPQAASDPKIVHLLAMQRAAEELKYLPSGDAKMQAIMARADQIMRSQGWIPKPSS